MLLQGAAEFANIDQLGLLPFRHTDEMSGTALHPLNRAHRFPIRTDHQVAVLCFALDQVAFHKHIVVEDIDMGNPVARGSAGQGQHEDEKINERFSNDDHVGLAAVEVSLLFYRMTVTEIKAMLPETPLRSIELPQDRFPHLASGKVRDLFDLGDRLLMVASDRISAFDVILPGGIAGKGIVLTQLSLWWFAQTAHLCPNHLVPEHDQALAELLQGHEALIPRAMLVRKLQPVPLEAVVRGYLAGSGLKEYQQKRSLWGTPLPQGLSEGSALPRPLFTPTTKAHEGHDEPIDPAFWHQLAPGLPAGLLPEQDAFWEYLNRLDLAAHPFANALEHWRPVEALSLQLYTHGHQLAKRAGLILADTKFEFGLDADGTLTLMDEVLTPDSSRYWPADQWAPGQPQPSFDKQFVRDYLETLDWNKTAPGPELPAEVTTRTLDKYLTAFQRLAIK